MDWRNCNKLALHWEYNEQNDLVTCNLCPNYCKLKENQTGTCGVRKHSVNQLFTMNYGYCICPVQETIETEAVFHFRPGSKILSMGNIGCNMQCAFCQNWETSQIRYLGDDQVQYISPEETVQLAVENNIGIISWTYNDPVVWHEFVLETSRLAKKQGILTLYKSALNINREPIEELIECIDIFSISLKSMEEEDYKKVMKGSLKAVLDGTRQIYSSGKHLETSQLVVTGLNDTEEKAAATARWILDNLDDSVPLHYVSYHPAYHYFEERSSQATIEKLCNNARKLGIKHCYAGNIWGGTFSNTFCLHCGNLLVERIGLSVFIPGISADRKCIKCQQPSPVEVSTDFLPSYSEAYGIDTFEAPRCKTGGESDPVKNSSATPCAYPTAPPVGKDLIGNQTISQSWEGCSNFHLLLLQPFSGEIHFQLQRFPEGEIENHRLKNGLRRVLISRKRLEEKSFILSLDNQIPVQLLPLLDRAHFPIK